MLININFTVASFPIGWTGNYNQFAQELVSLMTAQLQGNILPGIYSQTAFTLPTSDQGPIFMAGQWYYWSITSGAYVLYNSLSVGYARSDNVLDNGDFQINQRNPGVTSNPSIAALSATLLPNSYANYLSDRWIVIQDGTLSNTPTQSIVTNAGILGSSDRPNTIYCLRIIANSTATPTLSAGQFCIAMQRVELQRAKILWDVQPSLSIWLRSSIVGTFCVFVQNASASMSVVMPCTITLVNTFQKFTFPAMQLIPYASGGFGSLNTDWALTVGVCAAAGGNFQQSPAADGVWQSATRYCDSNQTNLLATGSATLDMTLAQYEPAGQVTAFQFKSFQDSLFACQYMFAKSMPYLVAPGTGGGSNWVPNCFYPFDSSHAYGVARFPRRLRIGPLTASGNGTSNTNLQIYNPASGAQNTTQGVTIILNATAKTNLSDTGFTEIDSSAGFGTAVSASFLTGVYSVDWTVSADL